MTKIRLLNVKYSPNLGDGVIADCLEHELARIRPGWDVGSVDLAGRTEFAAGGDSGRGLALSVLSALPEEPRRQAMAALVRVLIARRYRGVWARALAGTDAVILGGGQLLSDVGLNFSQKVHHCLAEAETAGARAAIFAVGVSHPWTEVGRRQFLDAFESIGLAHVAVRDAGSQANWARHTAGTGLPPAGLCRDPGLLAASAYGPAEAGAREGRTEGRPRVGVGVVHPHTLAHHGGDSAPTPAEALRFWTELAGHLSTAGYEVRFFTNGAGDDEAFLTKIMAGLDARLAGAVSRAPRPLRPETLVAEIAGMDALVAHRLHANIVAYAYAIPSVGLGWDAKVPAFFASIGRGEFALDASPPDAAVVATAAARALATPVDPEQHAAVLADTREGIAACADAIDRALA